MFSILLKSLGIPFTDIYDRNSDDDIVKWLIEHEITDVKFEDLSDSEKKLVRSWFEAWFIRRYDYAIKWANEIVRQSKTGKNTFYSLIDDL